MSSPNSGSVPQQPHPDEWENDLNPDFMAGMNAGRAGERQEKEASISAHDIKELRERFTDMDRNQLRQMIIMPEGARLEQGATYVDLNDPRRREFTATADMTTGPDNYYVPKKEVDYQLWNRLIGVHNPERLGQASE